MKDTGDIAISLLPDPDLVETNPQPDSFLQYSFGIIFLICLLALAVFLRKWWDLK